MSMDVFVVKKDAISGKVVNKVTFLFRFIKKVVFLHLNFSSKYYHILILHVENQTQAAVA